LWQPGPGQVAVGYARRVQPLSPPEVTRRLNQHGDDIMALYELLARVDRKVDAVDARVAGLAHEMNTRFTAVDTTLVEILQLLRQR
jgi:hypothetical protein